MTPAAVATIEMRYPDGTWRQAPDRHNLIGQDEPVTAGQARELAEIALQYAVRLRTTEASHERCAWPLRATVRHEDTVIVELETECVLQDAATNRPVRAATWAELELSVCSTGGVFELDGRQVYVA